MKKKKKKLTNRKKIDKIIDRNFILVLFFNNIAEIIFSPSFKFHFYLINQIKCPSRLQSIYIYRKMKEKQRTTPRVYNTRRTHTSLFNRSIIHNSVFKTNFFILNFKIVFLTTNGDTRNISRYKKYILRESERNHRRLRTLRIESFKVALTFLKALLKNEKKIEKED
jgi:hypothetical protein